MALTARPSKKIDLSKIDEIQNEFFDDETSDTETGKKNNSAAQEIESPKPAGDKERESESRSAKKVEISPKSSQKMPPKQTEKAEKIASPQPEQGSQKIADLLATAKTGGVRHTSRPFSVPRSLTIDLNRMKSKFKARDLHYTQNELMDKMVKESLETVTADNYYDLREKAFAFVKSPEQSSRRTVTLTEDAVLGMADLKGDLALKQNRRVSSDEIFTTLLAIAFSTLYENGLL
jgi:hypothetical protein